VTEYGKTLFSFGDPRGPQWAMLALGIALLAAGGLLILIFAVEGTSRASSDDVAGVVALIAMMAVPGAVLVPFALRNLITRPEWHVTATHAFRARGAEIVRVIVLRDQPSAELTQIQRYGSIMAVRVDLGRAAIIAPSVDIARAVVEAWRGARET
jgi:hypothetical protein